MATSTTALRAPLLHLRPRAGILAAAAAAAATAIPPAPPRPPRRPYATTSSTSSSKAPPDPNKPILLEQPTKFVPPSHGSRRRGEWTMPRIYGRRWAGSDDGQVATAAGNNSRWYPGLMAPAGSWEHWFWHSRAVHTWITMGTLVSLAVSTFILNFTTNSPFRHELPENALFWQDPIEFVSRWRHVIRLHDEDRNKKLVEMRNRQADDALKRRQYMRAHGIETEGVLGKLIKSDDEEATAEKEEKVPVTKVGERMARSGGQ
jgi:hypothetical protein